MSFCDIGSLSNEQTFPQECFRNLGEILLRYYTHSDVYVAGSNPQQHTIVLPVSTWLKMLQYHKYIRQHMIEYKSFHIMIRRISHGKKREDNMAVI